MKERLKGLLWRGQHCLLLAMGCMPLGVMLLMHSPVLLLPRLWLMAGLFLLAGCVCLLLPGRLRILGGVVCAAALIAAGVFLFRVQEAAYRGLIPAAFALLLIPVLPMGGWSSRRELAVAWPLVGLVIYCAAQLLLSVGETYPDWQQAARPVLLVSFLLFAALVLLSLNRSSLDNAALSRRTPPAGMRRMNLLLTLALMVLGVLTAAIPQVGQGLAFVWNWMMRLIAMAAAFIASFLPDVRQGTAGGAPAGGMGLPAGESAPPSAFLQILEKVLMVAALLVAAVLLVLLLRVVGKRLLALARWLLQRLTRYQAAAGEDYVDEITDTRGEEDAERQSLLRRLQDRMGRNERGLTPTQRVRLRYRRLKQTHRGWKTSDTARETLPESAAAIYEKARYGGAELTGDEEECFRTDTRRI